MQRTDFNDMPCPVARSLARVGERWNILILRDAFYGMTRFDEFRKSLDIAPNILSKRLEDLVQDGLLEKRAYNEKPLRYEYRLTEVARDFRPVMLAFMEWGNRHFAPNGAPVQPVSRITGAPVVTGFIDTSTGQPVATSDCTVEAGPAATPLVRARVAFAARKRAGVADDEQFDPNLLECADAATPAGKRSQQ
jgi:DNA-binding HxlR family transcriptional regulator